jgi:hypothetical protein
MPPDAKYSQCNSNIEYAERLFHDYATQIEIENETETRAEDYIQTIMADLKGNGNDKGNVDSILSALGSESYSISRTSLPLSSTPLHT